MKAQTQDEAMKQERKTLARETARAIGIAAVATLLAGVAMFALTLVLFVATLVAEYSPGYPWITMTADQYLWRMAIAGAAACLLVNGARLSFAILVKVSPAAEGQSDSPAAPVDTLDPCWTGAWQDDQGKTWIDDPDGACRCTAVDSPS